MENETNNRLNEETHQNEQQENNSDQPQEIDNTTTQIDTPVEHHGSKKKIIVILVGLLFVLAGAIFALMLLRDSNDNETSLQPIDVTERVTTLGATIATVEGSVQYSNDGDAWKDAEGGESLAHLDYIRTLDDSRVIVLFDDGSIVRLDENTRVYLSSLQKETSEVTLEYGKAYSRVVESENHTYTVVTANERFKALGTAFTTSVEETKDELQVYESDVEVESQDVVVGEGNKYDTESKQTGAIDLDALKEDKFAQWNKEKDSAIDEFKDKLGVLAQKAEEPEEEPPTPSSEQVPAGIQLSGSKSEKGVKLSWTVSGLNTKQGFKVVRDKTDSTPSYGQNEALYVSDSSARSTVWYDDNGSSYYYRVCIYNEGSCSNYSNSVKVDSPLVKKAEVVSGEVTLTISGNKLSWSLVGGSAPHGFKILMAETENPTYPSHSIKYVGAETSSVSLPDKSAGTYYVRICKYTNGTQESGCVDYSNQVEYVIE